MNIFIKNFEISKKSIIGIEIMKLFINSETKFVSLFIPKTNFCHISGDEHCFSEIEYLGCDYNDINSNILERLAIISTSIKVLGFNYKYNDTISHGIVKLIEVQKNLKGINFVSTMPRNKPYRKALEESIIKCADTVQYLKISWSPVTKFLSYLVNLVRLEIKSTCDSDWNHLINVSLPCLKFLKAQNIPPIVLENLIENTKGYLIEIIILYRIEDDGKLIRKIYQNCPNLNYLKLKLSNNEFLEFKNLLINCQFLIGLEIIGYTIDWDNLLELLKFSSISLFKFKFTAYFDIWEDNLKHLKLFLDNWNDRHSMLLHITTAIRFLTLRPRRQQQQQHVLRQRLKELLQEYKVKSIIKDYNIDGFGFKEFEWNK
ncbi:unnamed protein product [Rhizophagus irregularis]|nr:unnamed protein product [Rhizophagus irregularis]